MNLKKNRKNVHAIFAGIGLVAAMLIAFVIAGLIYFPLPGILLLVAAFVLAGIFIKRKHLTFFEEEYAPDIPPDEFIKKQNEEN